jgi:hypothetical protein
LLVQNPNLPYETGYLQDGIDKSICGRSRPFMKYPGLVSNEGALKNYGQVFA